jgi:UDP-N-acetylglucosamine--N-acetylmuramyl-(pentapeptide) pyrophosphoryl-undecaprenol N-acetylglucosamine transferase
VRSALLAGDRDEARRQFCLAGDRPLLYITGGAQGAQGINDAVAGCLTELLGTVEVIHQTGPNELNGSYAELRARSEELPAAENARYHLVERVGAELAHIYAAADLVLSRSGAGTVTEISAIGLPSILVPLPGADEQLANAEVLANTGAAIIIEQSQLTAERLLSEIVLLASDTERLSHMAALARSPAPVDAARRLADEVLNLAGLPADSWGSPTNGGDDG